MPPAGETTKWWGWGRADKSFHLPGAELFSRFLAERLGPLGTSARIESLDELRLPPSRLSDPGRKLLEAVVGADGVSTEGGDRAVHSLGKAYLDLIRIRQGAIPRPTDAVLYPQTESQVESLVNLARERDWILIPFGGGTSVVGGVEPPEGERAVLTVDLRRLDRILNLDAESRLATVECGILGPDLERQLNAAGFTLGHFPQSFEFSTLGGWIATRAAGHGSIRYGKIEHLVLSLRVVTPAGVIETPSVPASATGPDLLQTFVGSEGAYGIITRATMKLHPLPRHRRFLSFLFRSFEEGMTAVRDLLQEGFRPSVVRLSDEEETGAAMVLGGMTASVKGRLGQWWIRKRGWSLAGSSLLVLIFEAGAGRSWREIRAQMAAVRDFLRRRGSLFLGRGPARSWYRGRFEIPYFRDLLLDRAVMVDTLETASTWQNLPPLHRAVKSALVRAIEEEGERPLVMTHLSHAYPEGASLYYTFLARQKAGQEEAQYATVKKAATESILQSGGALSHHHGIGTLHKPWMRPYWGDLGVRLMGRVKATLDPEGSLNPHVLVEEEPAAPAFSGSFGPRARSANLARFSEEEFDLVIIGGGITGAGIARDAAMRAMKVALLEKSDFASGTSSRSSKMIHGGLRYLRQLDIRLVRESLAERQLLLELAPHLVQPAPHLIPSYKGRWEKIEIEIGMIGYDLLASSHPIAPYEKLSGEEVAAREPLLRRQGLRGGFIYYDCLVDDARLTLATVKSAAEHGAAVANHVKCSGLERNGDRIQGVRFEDVLGGLGGTLRARVVVNATGPWTDAVRALAGEAGRLLRPTKGVHLVVPRSRLDVQHVVVLFTPDDRVIFVVPHGAFTFIGTTDTDFAGDPDEVRVDAEDVSYLLRTVNDALQGANLAEADIVSTWAGLRPLLKEEGRPSEVSRDYELHVGASGLVTIAGGKLTTYRSMAEAVLDEVLERFGSRFERRFADCKTAKAPLCGGNIADFPAYADELRGTAGRWALSPEILEGLLRRYGTHAPEVASLGPSVLNAEVLYAVEEEMAMTIEDFMRRRSDRMCFGGAESLEVMPQVARLMGGRLGWDAAERSRQIENYRCSVDQMMAFRSPVRKP